MKSHKNAKVACSFLKYFTTDLVAGARYSTKSIRAIGYFADAASDDAPYLILVAECTRQYNDECGWYDRYGDKRESVDSAPQAVYSNNFNLCLNDGKEMANLGYRL